MADIPSVIHQLGPIAEDPSVNIGWIIGRPIVASAAMAVLTPLLCKLVFSPVFRRHLEPHLPRFKHVPNAILMALVLSAFIAISSYAGASVLYGSFLAGAFLSGLPSTHTGGAFVVESREEGEAREGKTPGFEHSFERYLGGAQRYILQPLFFASIGFAIPFGSLWTGEAIWKGVVATILMVIGKVGVAPSQSHTAAADAERPPWESAYLPSSLEGASRGLSGAAGSPPCSWAWRWWRAGRSGC